jgi:hypothetical protein
MHEFEFISCCLLIFCPDLCFARTRSANPNFLKCEGAPSALSYQGSRPSGPISKAHRDARMARVDVFADISTKRLVVILAGIRVLAKQRLTTGKYSG